MRIFRRYERVELTFHPVGLAAKPEEIEVRATDTRTGERRAALPIREMGAWLSEGGFTPILGVPLWERRT